MPALVHLVEPPLQHDRVILAGEGAEQLAAGTVERGVHVVVRLDFRLQILQRTTIFVDPLQYACRFDMHVYIGSRLYSGLDEAAGYWRGYV